MKSSKSATHPSDTLRILNLAGTPFAETISVQLDEVDESLLQYAISNRMHLYFLESLKRNNIDIFTKEFRDLNDRHKSVNETIVKVAEALEKNSVGYTFFKTVRPYREITVDIDTIILDDWEKATPILEDAGHNLLEVGPLSTTLRDEKSEINIDVYREVSVSHIIYIDKKKIQPFVVEKTVGNGHSVKSLDAVADLLAIISHSLIKEQMYVLSEYFTTIHYLHQMNNQEIDKLVETAERWKLKKAMSVHLSITSLLHMKAHGFIPNPLKKLLETVSYNHRETKRNKKRNYQTPHKYHPLTVVDSIVEKLSEPTAKRSFATQLVKTLNPTFASGFAKEALRHLYREKY